MPPNDRATASPKNGRYAETSRAANGNVDTSAEESRSANRRRHQQMAQEPPERVSSSRDGRTGPSTATPSKPVAPHEPPAAEMNAYGDEAAPPPVVGMGEYTDQSRRGTRSRHDGRMQKRDKNIKFGDYILGNVIGEGEFGKVRLGWKQDDRVQVRIDDPRAGYRSLALY